MDKKILNIGIIGLGFMGQNHLRILSILKNVNIKFVYDKNLLLTKKIAKEYKLNFIIKIKEIPENIDALILATPTTTHYKYIIKLHKKIPNIFVEKPLSTNLKEIKKIEVISKKTLIFVGLIERFNPIILTIKELLKNKKEIYHFDFVRLSNAHNRVKDTDVIFDLMIHDIDLAVCFNGEVKNIKAYGIKRNNRILFVDAILLHKNNKITKIQSSLLSQLKERKIRIVGNDFQIYSDLLKKEISLIEKSEIQDISFNSNLVVSSYQKNIEIKPGESLLNELKFFIKLCTKKKKIYILIILSTSQTYV